MATLTIIYCRYFVASPGLAFNSGRMLAEFLMSLLFKITDHERAARRVPPPRSLIAACRYVRRRAERRRAAQQCNIVGFVCSLLVTLPMLCWYGWRQVMLHQTCRYRACDAFARFSFSPAAMPLASHAPHFSMEKMRVCFRSGYTHR